MRSLRSVCMHGKTQNANQSFNSLIWERAPKIRYCGLSKLKFSFNYGGQSIIDTLKLLNVTNPGNMIQDTWSLSHSHWRVWKDNSMSLTLHGGQQKI